jgi:HD-like signal output (HDOD) protein
MICDHTLNSLQGRRGKTDTAAPRQFLWRLLSEYLPRPPFWWQQLNGVLNAGAVDLTRTVELINYEPSFCSEFMRICRLAELPAADDRLDNIVVWLGKERSRAVMVGAFLSSYLAAQNAPVLIEFGRRTERLASMAYRLALSSDEIDAQEAYVAGLLYHAGTLPLLRTIDPDSELSPAWLDFSLESLTAQWLLFGTDTIELGQAMALLWDYPPALTESLRVSQDATEDVPGSPLAYVVRAADQLCAAGLQAPQTYINTPPLPLDGDTLAAKRSNVLRFTSFRR